VLEHGWRLGFSWTVDINEAKRWVAGATTCWVPVTGVIDILEEVMSRCWVDMIYHLRGASEGADGRRINGVTDWSAALMVYYRPLARDLHRRLCSRSPR
jgi:hypothetical protein